MKRFALLFATILLGVTLFAAPAAAQDNPKLKVTETLELGTESLEGILLGPGDTFVSVRGSAKMNSLIQFRFNFISEMVKMAENL